MHRWELGKGKDRRLKHRLQVADLSPRSYGDIFGWQMFLDTIPGLYKGIMYVVGTTSLHDAFCKQEPTHLCVLFAVKIPDWQDNGHLHTMCTVRLEVQILEMVLFFLQAQQTNKSKTLSG